MPRSNSSFGAADGGKVVSAAPAPGLRGGGNAPGGLRGPPVFARSSGSPAPRPPGSGADRRRALAVRPGHSDSGRDRRHRHGAGLAPVALPVTLLVVPRRS